MKKTFLIILIFSLFVNFRLYTQNFPKKNIDFQTFIQNIIGIPADDLNYEDLLESLGQFYISPIDLNKATQAQLASLFILTDKQINTFLHYREASGNLASIYELQVLEGYDLDTIYKILPFVTVNESELSISSIDKSIKLANQTLLFRITNILEQKKGYTPLQGRETVRYLGTPGSMYLRYKIFHKKDITAGFTLEKDDGEKLTFNPKKRQFYSDFNSFHFQIQNKGNWKNITLGDFTMQFGQGLVLSSGFYLGKGAETILSVRRNSLGVRPYTSVIESNFFRGAAATYQIAALEITGFASRNKRTANLVIDKLTGDEHVSSIDTDGFHRTQSEIDDKAVLTENNFGFHSKWQNKAKNLHLEFTMLNTIFDLPYIKANQNYNKYEFQGKTNSIVSLSHSYITNNLNFFGEVAQSKSGGIGLINGLILSLSKQSDLSFVLRNYDKNFHSIYANGFGENSRNINEKGAYLGYKYSPNRKWVATSSFDYFKFPEIKFGVDEPSNGIEFLQRITYNPTKTTHWNLQYREQHKPKNLKVVQQNIVTNTFKRNILLDFDKSFNLKWSVKSRLMGSSFHFANQSKTYGVALVQDANLHVNRLSFSTRLAYFNTDNYDNRQYVYEQDVLYAFSFPAYYGKGIRHYLLMSYSPIKSTQIQLRWARTDYFNQNVISSGLEEIAKSHKSEIKFQLKIDL